ncbi:hypothetical protein K2Q16_00760 [Patescibacteria group bacterium]|nr:hypothetical protein [Patescibacteria group bacterium]
MALAAEGDAGIAAGLRRRARDGDGGTATAAAVSTSTGIVAGNSETEHTLRRCRNDGAKDGSRRNRGKGRCLKHLHVTGVRPFGFTGLRIDGSGIDDHDGRRRTERGITRNHLHPDGTVRGTSVGATGARRREKRQSAQGKNRHEPAEEVRDHGALLGLTGQSRWWIDGD